jgi:hypothetical protein
MVFRQVKDLVKEVDWFPFLFNVRRAYGEDNIVDGT